MEIRIGCFPVLLLLLTGFFTFLRLVGAIDWSWVWVLSPLWIGTSLWLIAVIIIWTLIGWSDRD